MVNKAKIHIEGNTFIIRVWDPSDQYEGSTKLVRIQQILGTTPLVIKVGKLTFKSPGPYSLVNFGPKLSKQIRVD
jgi:hypothetical protein